MLHLRRARSASVMLFLCCAASVHAAPAWRKGDPEVASEEAMETQIASEEATENATEGRRLGFRAIRRFFDDKQTRAQRIGAIAPHSHRHMENASWWADKRGNWHSQAKQDETVHRLFDGVPLAPGVQSRFFVDLAANLPVILSNSRALERDHGWRGVCIDGNRQLLEKLLAERTCDVYEGVVMSRSGVEVEFTAPEVTGTFKSGWVDDTFGGIKSASMDNTETQPAHAQRKWVATKRVSVTLTDILNDAHAPSTIDYLSLDIEGAEFDALVSFDFAKYTFLVLTIERPKAPLRNLLRAKNYLYVKDLACAMGEQLWVHQSFAERASKALNLPPLDPAADQARCCAIPEQGVPVTSIDNGCCGYIGLKPKHCMTG